MGRDDMSSPPWVAAAPNALLLPPLPPNGAAGDAGDPNPGAAGAPNAGFASVPKPGLATCPNPAALISAKHHSGEIDEQTLQETALHDHCRKGALHTPSARILRHYLEWLGAQSHRPEQKAARSPKHVQSQNSDRTLQTLPMPLVLPLVADQTLAPVSGQRPKRSAQKPRSLDCLHQGWMAAGQNRQMGWMMWRGVSCRKTSPFQRVMRQG